MRSTLRTARVAIALALAIAAFATGIADCTVSKKLTGRLE